MDYSIFLQHGGKKSSKTKSKKCSKGQIMRNSYIKKSGTQVPPGCIQAQSNTGKKTSDELSRYLAEKDKIHELARKKFPTQSSKKCSKGYIMKEG